MSQHARFFKDEGFEFMTLIALGGTYFRLSEAGECLSTADRIKNGDYDSWFDEWTATAQRVRGLADQAKAAGHTLSARDAYLRASNYHNLALFFVLGTKGPERELDCWQAHEMCLDEAAAQFSPPAEKIDIPYEDTAMKGYFFKVAGDGTQRPLVILNNGSDGADIDMVASVFPALERGYNALIFAGPGQNHSLYVQKIPFRYDWENVVTPVVDYALTRGDIDPKRIVLSGVSQAGYWVPRAVAFEHRIAAAVADPGVFDVRTSWMDHIPKSLMKHYDKGEKAKFERQMAIGEKFSRDASVQMAKRTEPYCTDSVFDVLKELEKWNLKEVAAQIKCPLLITDPEDEQFWPGQSQQLYDALGCPKTLVHFSAQEGANWHCEPMAPGLRAQRVFDWIEETLA